jgi:hypothetical protein
MAGDAMMLHDCWIPDWLYNAWPWMCAAIAGGYALAGYPSATVVVGIYTFAVFMKRI